MITKEHYFHLLDGLRGIAALIVMWRHTGCFWSRARLGFADD